MTPYVLLTIVVLVGGYLYWVAFINNRDLWRMMLHHRTKYSAAMHGQRKLAEENRSLRAIIVAAGLQDKLQGASPREAAAAFSHDPISRPISNRPAGRRIARYLKRKSVNWANRIWEEMSQAI